MMSIRYGRSNTMELLTIPPSLIQYQYHSLDRCLRIPTYQQTKLVPGGGRQLFSFNPIFRKLARGSIYDGFPWKISRIREVNVLIRNRQATEYPDSHIEELEQEETIEANHAPRTTHREWPKFIPLKRTSSRIAQFLSPQWSIILKGWICTCIGVGSLFLLVPQVGKLSNLLAQGDFPTLGDKVVWAIALVAIRAVSLFWQQALLWEAVLNITYEVRSHVFERMLQRDMSFFEGQDAAAAGDIAFRVTSEAEDFGDTVYSLLHMFVPSALQLIAMAARMITLNPLLSGVILLVAPSMSVAVAILGEKLRKLSRKGQQAMAKMSAYLNEVFPSMLIVKAYSAQNLELQHFKSLAWAERDARLKKKRMNAFIPQVITGVYAATAVILFMVGTWSISKGRFDGQGMVSFITSLALLIEPIQAIGKAYNEIKQGEPAIERLFDLISFSSQVGEEDEAQILSTVSGKVEFSDVSFRYKEGLPWVISNFSLCIGSGEKVALVGGSGSGKTTIAKLLLRLYDPVHGTISIDGKDIRELNIRSLRQQVAIVPQETVLFTGTVAENIAYGRITKEIDMVAVQRAAQLANADEFIIKLSEGYLTNLGDRASSLSGGQRQRVAIARAIYHGPGILILDEATSALDNNSEKLVREALEHLMVGRTVFIIAHRLETVESADRILLLEGGQVVEDGTHSSLLSDGGKYAALYRKGMA